jgi:hypothetical protein
MSFIQINRSSTKCLCSNTETSADQITRHHTSWHIFSTTMPGEAPTSLCSLPALFLQSLNPQPDFGLLYLAPMIPSSFPALDSSRSLHVTSGGPTLGYGRAVVIHVASCHSALLRPVPLLHLSFWHTGTMHKAPRVIPWQKAQAQQVWVRRKVQSRPKDMEVPGTQGAADGRGDKERRRLGE